MHQLHTDLSDTPTLDDQVYRALPDLIKQCVIHFTDPRERDTVLMASLCALSAIFPTVKGRYGGDVTYSNLYALILAPAASGKGKMGYARMLIEPIEAGFRKENEVKRAQYQTLLAQWKRSKSKIQQPPVRSKMPHFLLPGNMTGAALIKGLHDSDGVGFICESEIDTFSNSMNGELGRFSDTFRKAFHHEPVSVIRSTDDYRVIVQKPRLSVLLSGTPEQLPRLIHSTEDGLFSRFCFYGFSTSLTWRDPSPCSGCVDLDIHFQSLAEKVSSLYDGFNKEEHTFSLTPDQFKRLNQCFEQKIKDVSRFEGHNAASIVYRMGLICYRITMIYHFSAASCEPARRTNAP